MTDPLKSYRTVRYQFGAFAPAVANVFIVKDGVPIVRTTDGYYCKVTKEKFWAPIDNKKGIHKLPRWDINELDAFLGVKFVENKIFSLSAPGVKKWADHVIRRNGKHYVLSDCGRVYILRGGHLRLTSARTLDGTRVEFSELFPEPKNHWIDDVPETKSWVEPEAEPSGKLIEPKQGINIVRDECATQVAESVRCLRRSRWRKYHVATCAFAGFVALGLDVAGTGATQALGGGLMTLFGSVALLYMRWAAYDKQRAAFEDEVARESGFLITTRKHVPGA